MKKLAEIIYNKIDENKEYEDIINIVVDKCFKNENLSKLKLYISITLTVPEEIQKINKKYRNIDRPTDVLSFPMFEQAEINELLENGYEIEEALGDIIISIPKVHEQAEEYGHSFERELSYMIVHGFYHLMGYDHMEKNDKEIMRAKEDEVLNALGISR